MINFITNLKNRATSQRLFDFNSMCKFGETWLFANSDGLMKICGDDDNGVDIDAYFEPVTSDFGISNPKQGRYIHMGFETDGELEIAITFDGKTTETISVEPQSAKTGQQRITEDITKAGQGRYCNTKVSNVDGSDFSIDAIEVDMYVLPQRKQDY